MATTKKNNGSYIEQNFVVKNSVNFIPPEGSEIIIIARLVPRSNETCNYEIKSSNGKPAAIYMVKGMSATLPFDEVLPKFVYSCVEALNEYKIKTNIITDRAIINGVQKNTINVLQLPYVSKLDDPNKNEDLFIVLQKSMMDIDEKTGELEIKTSSHSYDEDGVGGRGNIDYNKMQGKIVTRDYIKALSVNDKDMIKRLVKSSNEYVDSLNITSLYGKITSTVPESVNDLI